MASMAHAANHGADMIEFDVQLSKDMIPVIYHDFYVYTAMLKKAGKEQKNGSSNGTSADCIDGQVNTEDMLHLPLKELTLAQLQKLKVYHVKETSRVPKLNDDDFDDHQPFPTLQRVLENLDPHVGFNVEIKWTMVLKVPFVLTIREISFSHKFITRTAPTSWKTHLKSTCTWIQSLNQY